MVNFDYVSDDALAQEADRISDEHIAEKARSEYENEFLSCGEEEGE